MFYSSYVINIDMDGIIITICGLENKAVVGTHAANNCFRKGNIKIQCSLNIFDFTHSL